MRSASPIMRRPAVAGLAALAGAGALAGCASTQEKAARLRLNSARIVASQSATRVTTPGVAVAVLRTALVSAAGHTAFVVTVGNSGRRAVSDLPISVGYRPRGRHDVYVNAGADLPYFDAHLPAIAGHATLTWVYTVRRRLPAGVRPFARVGPAPAVPGAALSLPPAIRAEVRAPGAGGRVTVAVRNLSGVPQLQLPVYAVAERDGHPVAAAEQTLAQLAANASQTVRLRLLGAAGRSAVQVQAAPTIFH